MNRVYCCTDRKPNSTIEYYWPYKSDVPESSTNGTAKTAIVSLTLVKAQGILGDDGGFLGLPGFEIMLAIPAIAFVAKRFKN